MRAGGKSKGNGCGNASQCQGIRGRGRSREDISRARGTTREDIRRTTRQSSWVRM
jgi:hypothetical protein